jgi:hypothetical protein
VGRSRVAQDGGRGAGGALPRDAARAGRQERNAGAHLPQGAEQDPGSLRAYTYDEIVARDKASLDIFWLRDESLEDSASLPEPHVLAAEIADDLRASLEQIEDVLADLQVRAGVEAQKRSDRRKRDLQAR